MKISNQLKKNQLTASQFIKIYNKNIERIEKATAFFENEDIPMSERNKNKYLIEYVKITQTLSILQKRYKEMFGGDMPKEDITGFKNKEGNLI